MDNLLLSYHKKVKSLKSIEEFNRNRSAYANKIAKEGQKDWWRWNSDFSYMFPAFRSVMGRGHTFYVLDIDFKLPKSSSWFGGDPIIDRQSKEFKNLYSEKERRKIFLQTATEIANSILEKDPDFFVYFSGKGIFLTRIVPFITKPINIYGHIRNLIDPCECKDIRCREWHEKRGTPPNISKLASYFDEEGDEYLLQVTIDNKMYGKEVNNVFRIPYSLYKGFKSTTYVCAPVVRDGKLIDFEASYKRTKYDANVIFEEFTIPRFTNIAKDDYIPSPGELESIDEGSSKNKKYYPMSERKIGKLYREGLLPAKLVEKIETMVYLISNDNTDITPPCIYRAYQSVMFGDGKESHQMRVVIGRYLRTLGFFKVNEDDYDFSNTDVALLFVHRINDTEDNSPENHHKLEQNMTSYIIPKYYGNHFSNKCSTHQDPSSSYFCCDDEQRNNCSRTRPIFKNKQMVQLEVPKVEEEEEDVISEEEEIKKYRPTLDKMLEIMRSGKHTIIEKTTRAGCTTSSVVANQHLTNKKLLIIVPTTSIAQKTFADSVEIVKKYDVPPVLGGVFTSNAEGCVIMNVEKQQHIKKWNKDEEVSYMTRLPFIGKPSCAKCHFSTNIFDVRDGLIIESDIKPTLLEMDVTKVGAEEYGKCAKISLHKELFKTNVVTITYAKLMALMSGSKSNAENKELLENLYEFDTFLFDESSHITSLDHHTFLLKTTKWGNSRIYTSRISEQVTIIKNLIKESGKYHKDRHLNLSFELFKTVEIYFNTMIVKLNDGADYLTGRNPLEIDEREVLFNFYRVIQKQVMKHNVDLILLAKLVMTAQTEEWYFEKIVDKDSITTTYQMHSSPDSAQIKSFMQQLVTKKKQILLTDATPSRIPMDTFLGVDFVYENFGDPRDIDSKSLIITDNKKLSITQLTDDGNYSPLEDVDDFIRKLILEFGAGEIFVIFPNSDIYKHYKKNYMTDFHIDLMITYYRSNYTMGVASERRIMLSVGYPLPPADSLRYQSHFFTSYFNDPRKGTSADFDRVQSLLVQDSANSSLFQGIGRVKCPQGKQYSIVFFFGMKRDDIQPLIESYSTNYTYSKESDHKALEDYMDVAKMWRDSKRLLSSNFFDVVNHVKGRKKGIDRKKLKESIKSETEFNYLLSEEGLNRWGLFENIKTNTIEIK